MANSTYRTSSVFNICILYSTNGPSSTFPMQDMLHNIKNVNVWKQSAQPLVYTVIRWDYVFEIIKIRNDLLVQCLEYCAVE